MEKKGKKRKKQNITEQKKIEKELIISENHYRTIFEISESAITIADEEGFYKFVNPKSEELYGLSKEPAFDERCRQV